MTAVNLIVLTAAFAVGDETSVPTPSEIHQTIERSIPYIEEKGVSWIESKDCVSCHRVGMMTWSLTAAKQQGFRVSDGLDEWLTWSIKSSLKTNDKGKLVGAGNKEGLIQLMMTTAVARNAEANNDSLTKFVAMIAEDQTPDGSWTPGGQLPSQKRSKEETTAVTTMWLTLALLDHRGEQKDQDVVAQALQHIRASDFGKSTEWYATRLLLASRLEDTKTVNEIISKLRSQQRADGGWGWLIDEESDALGTGLALYALLQAGQSDEAMIDRGVRYLVDNQNDDGSWPVRGTKEKKRGSVQETATYWGTTWAVLALLESLPGRVR